MAVEQTRDQHLRRPTDSLRYLAGSAIAQGDMVKISTTSGVVAPCGDNDIHIGVAQNAVTAAQITAYEAGTGSENEIWVEVSIAGIEMTEAADAIADGAFVTTAAAGEVKAAATDGTDVICGIAITESLADGDWIAIKILHIPAND
jgi:hypothetical protein